MIQNMSRINRMTDSIEILKKLIQNYEKWIISYLKTYKKGKRSDFVDLLSDKLSDSLTDKQKENKVRNLLMKMKRKGIITTDSPNKRLANCLANYLTNV